GFPDASCVEDSHLFQFVKLGVLADLTSRVKPYVPKIIDYKWQPAEQAGHYYAMPWDAGPVALFYRRSVFKQAHVNPQSLQTWNDARTATLPMAVWMGTFLKSFVAPKTSGDWGVVPLPAWTASGSHTANDGGSALAVFKSSSQMDAAWAYIQYHLGRADTQST